jgi:hypothetical protein
MATDSDRQDPKITARLLRSLAAVPELFARINALQLAGLSPQSEAAKDAELPPGDDKVGQHVAFLATQHLSNGIQHLLAWHELFKAETQPIAAHLTLVRGAVEGAVLCRWLVDPGNDSAERLRRGAALQLEDYRHRLCFEEDWGISADAFPHGKAGAARREDLRRVCDKAGIVPPKVPGWMDLAGMYADFRTPDIGRGWYRLLSGYTHGMEWPLLFVTNVDVEGAPEVPGGLLKNISANDNMAAAATEHAVRITRTALDELADYEGRPR